MSIDHGNRYWGLENTFDSKNRSIGPTLIIYTVSQKKETPTLSIVTLKRTNGF